MANNIAIGIQSFDKLIEGNCYYIDKTSFIKEWWENKDKVTYIQTEKRREWIVFYRKRWNSSI